MHDTESNPAKHSQVPDSVSRRRFGLSAVAALPAATVAAQTHSNQQSAVPAQEANQAATTKKVRFALIGDTPYNDADERNLQQVLVAAAAEAEFVIHVGDIKSGISSCDNQALQKAIGVLDQCQRPLIFVPGDNEWTDCHRILAGQFDPDERLQALRVIAYGRKLSLGRGDHLAIESQHPQTLDGNAETGKGLPENLRWRAGPCLFVSLNVPGSRNGIGSVSDESVVNRNDANTSWLLDSVRLANEENLAGLVVVIHAEILPRNTALSDANADLLNKNTPYHWLRHLLSRATQNFNGSVMLLHGDYHVFINDYPLRDNAESLSAKPPSGVSVEQARRRLERFERVECFGSPLSAQYVIIELAAATEGEPRLKSLVATRSI